ncbi:dentin sialophosphoprotein-like [Pollicipes pollicipes]|uniref:dentin sialophosphoprotein-like n=1 Tax=Pollicipes pollicipes TaxID=41117 RepID=UPI0018858CAE|nr:dentin sialophosphoprotein-like [Pollicipes pollicipes]
MRVTPCLLLLALPCALGRNIGDGLGFMNPDPARPEEAVDIQNTLDDMEPVTESPEGEEVARRGVTEDPEMARYARILDRLGLFEPDTLQEYAGRSEDSAVDPGEETSDTTDKGSSDSDEEPSEGSDEEERNSEDSSDDSSESSDTSEESSEGSDEDSDSEDSSDEESSDSSEESSERSDEERSNPENRSNKETSDLTSESSTDSEGDRLVASGTAAQHFNAIVARTRQNLLEANFQGGKRLANQRTIIPMTLSDGSRRDLNMKITNGKVDRLHDLRSDGTPVLWRGQNRLRASFRLSQILSRASYRIRVSERSGNGSSFGRSPEG